MIHANGIETKKKNTFSFRLFDFTGRLFFSILYKLNSQIYMKLYPKFLTSLGIKIYGSPVFIAPSASFDSSNYSLISLGDKCVISGEVRLLTHDYAVSRVAEFKNNQFSKEFRFIKPVFIGENSFIGARSIIMPGVRIGKNVIVGAGSVVTKSVDDNLIVGGNPARKINTIDAYWDKIKSETSALYFE